MQRRARVPCHCHVIHLWGLDQISLRSANACIYVYADPTGYEHEAPSPGWHQSSKKVEDVSLPTVVTYESAIDSWDNTKNDVGMSASSIDEESLHGSEIHQHKHKHKDEHTAIDKVWWKSMKI